MGKVNYSLTIVAPIDKCINLLKNSINDDRYVKAITDLFSPSTSNFTINTGKDNRSMTVRVKGFDPITKINIGGWDISLFFTAVTSDVTQIEIKVEYSFFTACLGLGLMKSQAKNQIMDIINSLIILEKSLDSQKIIV